MSTYIVRSPFFNGLNFRVGAPVARSSEMRVFEASFDVIEDREGYTIVAALPGVSAEALEINFHEGVLTVSGEVAPRELPEGATYRVREIGAGRFERSFRFRSSVDSEAISANFEHGLLTLRVPRAEEAKPRKITLS